MYPDALGKIKSYVTPSWLKKRICSEIGEGNCTKKDTSFRCFTVVMTRRKTLWHSHVKNMLTGTSIRLQQSQTHTCRMTKFANTKIKIYCRPSKAAFRKNEKVSQEGLVQWPVGLVKANTEVLLTVEEKNQHLGLLRMLRTCYYLITNMKLENVTAAEGSNGVQRLNKKTLQR